MKTSPIKVKPIVKQEKPSPRPRETKSPHKMPPPSTTKATRGSSSNVTDFVSLGANGKDVVQGSGSEVRDLTDKVKATPKYQRLSHFGREGAATEEQPEAKAARQKMKAKVAVEKRRVATEEEFLEEELMFGSQQI